MLIAKGRVSLVDLTASAIIPVDECKKTLLQSVVMAIPVVLWHSGKMSLANHKGCWNERSIGSTKLANEDLSTG
jgi:hypothetical protein